MHESGGLLKMLLFNSGWKIRIYDPATLKQAWTGDGNAKKPAMIAAANAIFGQRFDEAGTAQDNIVDAFLLAKLLHLELQYRATGDWPEDACATAVEALTKRSRRKTAMPAYVDQPFACRENAAVEFAW